MGVPPESENESPRCAAKTALSPGAGPLLGAAPQACASALPYPASRLPRLSGLWGVLTRHPQHVISWGHLCFGPSIGQGPGVGVTGGPLQDTGGGLSTLRASVRTPRVTGLPALVLLERRTPPPRPTSDVLPGPLALHVAHCLVLFRPRVSSVRTRGVSALRSCPPCWQWASVGQIGQVARVHLWSGRPVRPPLRLFIPVPYLFLENRSK